MLPHIYDRVMKHFSDGFAAVEYNGESLIIDKIGKEVWSSIFENSNGLVPVEIDGKWGFNDKAGNEVIPPKYDQVRIGL